jgi:hypothetical protein
MKKIFLILALVIPFTLFSQESKKWFPSSATSYVALMRSTSDSLTMLMVGGEKSIYQLTDSTSLNFWYSAYVDRAIGYVYGGPSIYTKFRNGYASLGCAIGITSLSYKLIYSISSYGKFKKFNWYWDTEFNAWPNWHLIWLTYSFTDNIAIMLGSQACLGVGIGPKLSYKNLSLATMYHFKSGTYLGSENNGGGFSFQLNANL